MVSPLSFHFSSPSPNESIGPDRRFFFFDVVWNLLLITLMSLASTSIVRLPPRI